MIAPMETEKVGNHLTLDDLKSQLDKGGIDYAGWGKIPGSKSIEKLLRNINKGECRLIKDNDGKLVREVEQVGVFIFARDDSGIIYILREDHQEFVDGPPRSRDLGGVSFREKLENIKEAFNQAVIRGLKEELPEISKIQSQISPFIMSNSPLRIDSYRPPRILEESADDYTPSFPGLPNSTMEYRYTMMILPKAYKPDGYITKEEDKTTFFVWDKVSKDHPFLPATSWQKLTPAQMKEEINHRASNKNIIGLQRDVVSEYIFLKKSEVQTRPMTLNDFGSRLELKRTANSFRIMDLERIYPQLKNLKIIQ